MPISTTKPEKGGKRRVVIGESTPLAYVLNWVCLSNLVQIGNAVDLRKKQTDRKSSLLLIYTFNGVFLTCWSGYSGNPIPIS